MYPWQTEKKVAFAKMKMSPKVVKLDLVYIDVYGLISVYLTR